MPSARSFGSPSVTQPRARRRGGRGSDAGARHVPAPRVRQPRSPAAPGVRHRAGALPGVLRAPVAGRLPGGRVAMNARPLRIVSGPDDGALRRSSAACAFTPPQAVFETGSALEVRSYQSRVLQSGDRDLALRAVIATLQDLGFVLDSADASLGTVTATKLAQHQVRMTVIGPAGRRPAGPGARQCRLQRATVRRNGRPHRGPVDLPGLLSGAGALGVPRRAERKLTRLSGRPGGGRPLCTWLYFAGRSFQMSR